MVRLYYIMILLSIAVNCNAQQYTSNLPQSYQVNGVVSCITVRDSAAQHLFNNVIVCGPLNPPRDSGYTTHILDSRGNQLSCSYYAKDSTLIKHILNKYNDNNYRIQTAYRDGKDSLIGTYVFRYDANGFPTQRITYNGKDSITAILDLQMQYLINDYKECYDIQGRRTKMVNYLADCGGWLSDSDTLIKTVVKDTLIDSTVVVINGVKSVTITYNVGDESWKVYHKYDVDNNQTETIVYNNYGVKEQVVHREYNEHGNIIAVTQIWLTEYIVDGDKKEYLYDAHGNKVEYKYYNMSEDYLPAASNSNDWENWYVLSEHKLYDSIGRVTEHKQYYYGMLYSKSVNIYKGNVVNTMVYDRYNSLQSEGHIIYEKHDDRGNWLEMTYWRWDSASGIDNIPRTSYRIIKYYD